MEPPTAFYPQVQYKAMCLQRYPVRLVLGYDSSVSDRLTRQSEHTPAYVARTSPMSWLSTLHVCALSRSRRAH